MKALFLSHEHSISPGGGGQQQCSREYAEALRLAGFELVNVLFATDRSWRVRLRRKFRPMPYCNLIPEEFFERVSDALQMHSPVFVFCNLYNFIPFGPRLRKFLSHDIKLVLLSHGLASVDEVHAARIARRYSVEELLPQRSDKWVGAMLRIESEGVSAFDHVFTLSPSEAEVSRWLGARSVSWVPRALGAESLLPWNPKGDRVGCIGTFDHPPNLEGIELLCAAIKRRGPGSLRLRVISRSREVTKRLHAYYPFVDDLGAMEEPGTVESEAATWSAFIHPIFCYAMGCSTKLATGLNWGLPVLTTEAGARGYRWEEGSVVLADDPDVLAQNVLDVLNYTHAEALRKEVLKAVNSAPSLNDIAVQMRRDLGL